jgi:hypothetical protein
MFEWFKKIIDKKNSESEMNSFKDSVYSDDNRNIIDDDTVTESQEIVDNYDKDKKEVISKAEKKRQKDLEKLQNMNSSLNDGIKSLF